jgi:CheY-like chemotaxis protein
MMRLTARPILLIEDDQIDVMTVQRALKELHVVNRLDVAEHGKQALERLMVPNSERPCLILLDLNMPIMNGIEFLRVAKADPELKRIPVVVLTTSEEQRDKMDSFNLGVAGYMRKPVDYHQFVETIRSIDTYWTLSELPE